MAVKNIMIVGVGGQGTLLTSRILGGLTIAGGYDVKLSEVHGMAQRGGSVVTFVRYGEKVAEPIVEEGQADVIIAFERLEALYKVDATEESKKLGNPKVFNLIVLGVAAQHMDFTKEQWYEVIEKTVPQKTVELNKKAFDVGYTLK